MDNLEKDLIPLIDKLRGIKEHHKLPELVVEIHGTVDIYHTGKKPKVRKIIGKERRFE